MRKTETTLSHRTEHGTITYEFDSGDMNVREMIEEYRLFLLAISYQKESIEDVIGEPS